MEINCFKDVKLLVCVFIMLFGMGSWISTNGIWVELAILVDQLPEGWNLPSYLSVIIQMANIGPIVYTVGNLLFPNTVTERPVVFLMIVVGSAASLLLAFLWQETSYVAGAERSTSLFVLMFFVALIDCTSSVVYLPFMNIFKPSYMTSYYIGEGFSGLLPGLVSLAQGVGETECVNTSTTNTTTNVTDYSIQAMYLSPRFDVDEFFYFIFAMTVTSGLAFILLNYLSYCKSEHESSSQYVMEKSNSNTHEMYDETFGKSTEEIIKRDDVNDDKMSEKKEPEHVLQDMSVQMFAFYLVLIGWVNALTNGVLPSVQSYACLPYGSQTYHLAVTLSQIANPLACFIVFFIPIKSALAITLYTLSGTLISAYIMVLTVYSPEPPLVEYVIGSVLSVAAYVLISLFLTFTKVAIATLFRSEGRKALLWCGAVTQLGSAIGAAVMFVLVNVYEMFTQKYPCT